MAPGAIPTRDLKGARVFNNDRYRGSEPTLNRESTGISRLVATRANTNQRSSAFGGLGAGGTERNFASRGRSSFGVLAVGALEVRETRIWTLRVTVVQELALAQTRLENGGRFPIGKWETLRRNNL